MKRVDGKVGWGIRDGWFEEMVREALEDGIGRDGHGG